MCWHEAWFAYVRGNIVSVSAAKLIQSFLLKTLAGTDATAQEDDSDKEESDTNADIPALSVKTDSFRSLLLPTPEHEDMGDAENAETGATLGSKLRKSSRKNAMAAQFAKSMRLSQNVWASTDEILNFSSRVKPGHMYENNFEEHLAAKKSSKSSPEQVAPFDEERNAAAAFAFPNRDVTIDTVLPEPRREAHRRAKQDTGSFCC